MRSAKAVCSGLAVARSSTTLACPGQRLKGLMRSGKLESGRKGRLQVAATGGCWRAWVEAAFPGSAWGVYLAFAGGS